MNMASPSPEHLSYFWSCITLQEDCPFFSMTDPSLRYFGIGLIVFYVGFVLIILVDSNFYWGVDGIQQKLDHYVTLVKNKVQLVQKDQRRLMSMQERTEKQLKRSLECTRVLKELRGALAREDSRVFSELSALADRACSMQRSSNWHSDKSESMVDFNDTKFDSYPNDLQLLKNLHQD